MIRVFGVASFAPSGIELQEIHPKLQAEENSSSRNEMAGVPVGALLSKKRGATVEVYRSKTRQKIQPEFDHISGYEVTVKGK